MAGKSTKHHKNYVWNSPSNPVELTPLGEDAATVSASKGAARAAGQGARFVAAPFKVDSYGETQFKNTGEASAARYSGAKPADILVRDLWQEVQSVVADTAAIDVLATPSSALNAVLAVEPLTATPTVTDTAPTAAESATFAETEVAASLFAAAAPLAAPGNGNGGQGNVNAPGGGVGGGNVGSGNGNGGQGNVNAPGGGTGDGNQGSNGGGNGGTGNPNAPGGGTGDGNQGSTGGGNGGDGNPDSPGDGSGDGNQGGGSDHASAPTPPDVLVQDRETATYVSEKYVFSTADLTGDYDGNNANISDTITKTTKDGTVMYAVDSAFGFHVTDFIGATEKELGDLEYGEGWAGDLISATGDQAGMVVSNARTDVFKAPAGLGTWLQGIGGSTVKASSEHYSIMQDILSDQSYPGDTSGYYQLDDDLRMIDYRVGADGMPVDATGAASDSLVADVMHDFYIQELVDALGDAATGDAFTLQYKDFDRDGVADAYYAYYDDVLIDGVVRNVAVVDIVDTEGTDIGIDYYDGNLNGFGTFGIQDILKPNESSIIEDIAYSDDYSVTLKDDGKLLYRWGNAIKRPNDIRIDAKIDLPEEDWQEVYEEGDPAAGLLKLWHVTAAELVVNHTVTNNPNDQIRPEDFENEAAIGQLPDYVVVRDPADTSNTLWVSPHNMFTGDGTFLPSYFKLTEEGEIDLDAGGTPVFDAYGMLIGYQNEDELGNAIGTVFRDFSRIDAVEGSTLDLIGAMSEDLKDGFTKEWYTTMDREPFQAVLNEDGEYEIGPRWRLQPDKYGQDLPSVTIPQDPSEAPPVQNGEEKYEVGADTTTVLNLLDWDGTSPLALSAGWKTGSGDASENGLNMTDDFDIAFYVKGDMKPVSLYDAELVMTYEEVDVHAAFDTIYGTDNADVLAGMGNNTFYAGEFGDVSDIIVLSYGADITDDAWDNTVHDFAVGEDALGLIGFDLDPDNYNIHLTQEVSGSDLLVSYDDTQIATLLGVTEHLEVDDFYFA